MIMKLISLIRVSVYWVPIGTRWGTYRSVMWFTIGIKETTYFRLQNRTSKPGNYSK